jgi:hypothetical protein
MATFEKSKDPKKKTIKLRISEDDYYEIFDKADAAGLSISEYMRRCALNKRIDSKINLKMIRELCRLGGLQKHWFNVTDGLHSDKTAKILNEIIKAIKRIAK